MHTSYDLHTHSSASDGAYGPSELVRQAASVGVTHLALSDHDSTAGLEEAKMAAQRHGIQLIPAVEISTTWLEKSVHIVGLNIDAGCDELRQGLHALKCQRVERAEEIGRRLAKHGIDGTFEAAARLAGTGMITRTHFARYLVELGLVPTVGDVFNRYLVRGKPGYVPTRWADLEKAVTWITRADGIAVVAHPQRYKLTASWMRRLLGEFKEMGGMALEVVSGCGHATDIQVSAGHARRFGLLASTGSDFHSPEHQWLKLGRLPALPADLTPVWSAWSG
ncbi:MAG: phosphotransferase protein [Proteobacteria bacterium]|nr:phosphotransferase protein [Pseudomonadota bacterium]